MAKRNSHGYWYRKNMSDKTITRKIVPSLEERGLSQKDVLQKAKKAGNEVCEYFRIHRQTLKLWLMQAVQQSIIGKVRTLFQVPNNFCFMPTFWS